MNSNKFDWKNISIQKYYDILDILQDEGLEDIQKQVALVAVITDMDEDEVWNMGLSESAKYISNLHFLSKFKPDHFFHPTKLKIGEREYKVMKDINNMTLSQFFDYQSYIRLPLKEGIEKLISIFLIPADKEKYNEGYDIIEIQKDIRNNMPFTMAQGFMGFILAKYNRSSQQTLKYLAKKIARVKEKEKREKLQEEYQRMRDLLQTTISLGYSAW